MTNLSLLMLLQAATFAIAASIHGGSLVSGYEHREARIAESIIAAVLIAGAGLAMLPQWNRRAALAAQELRSSPRWSVSSPS